MTKLTLAALALSTLLAACGGSPSGSEASGCTAPPDGSADLCSFETGDLTEPILCPNGSSDPTPKGCEIGAYDYSAGQDYWCCPTGTLGL